MSDDYDDDRDWTLDELAEREPDEPEQEPPVDLDEVGRLLNYATADPEFPDDKSIRRLLAVVPDLTDEIKTLREELAYWRALPIRTEYATACGGNTHPDDCTQAWHTTDADEALAWHKNVPLSRAWTRSITVHDWVELSAEAPF